MKSFLITVTILGAIIYGMLQINAYYDDRGACSWGLFGGGDYRHKERLDKAIKGIINYSIEQDKKARKKLMQQQGKNEAEINKTLKALEPQYKIEREKMQKYCYVDFNKTPYYNENINGYTNPTKYCEIGHGNNSGDAGYISYSVKYKFDKESHNFFNTIQYVHNKNKDNKIELYVFDGVEYETLYYPCEVRFKGIVEGSTVLITDKNMVSNFDKTKHVNIRF